MDHYTQPSPVQHAPGDDEVIDVLLREAARRWVALHGVPEFHCTTSNRFLWAAENAHTLAVRAVQVVQG